MVALCAQLLLRMLMAKAEGLAQTPMARGQDWGPLDKHPAGKAGSLPRREEGTDTLGSATQMDTEGTGRCRVTDNMPVGGSLSQLSQSGVQEEAALCWWGKGRGRGRRVTNKG